MLTYYTGLDMSVNDRRRLADNHKDVILAKLATLKKMTDASGTYAGEDAVIAESELWGVDRRFFRIELTSTHAEFLDARKIIIDALNSDGYIIESSRDISLCRERWVIGVSDNNPSIQLYWVTKDPNFIGILDNGVLSIGAARYSETVWPVREGYLLIPTKNAVSDIEQDHNNA